MTILGIEVNSTGSGVGHDRKSVRCVYLDESRRRSRPGWERVPESLERGDLREVKQR